MTKKNTVVRWQILIFLAVLLINFSCNRSDNESTDNELIPKIFTFYSQDINGKNITLGGEIKEKGKIKIIRRGVCWSIKENPTIESNNFKEDKLDIEGKFYFALANELKPATKYFVRAFYETTKGIKYGDIVSFNTEAVNTIKSPMHILKKSVTLRGEIVQEESEIRTVGFTYSTTPNPIANRDKMVTKKIQGSASYEIVLESELNPNRIYYVRGFIMDRSGEYSYTEEKQFHTTGYLGPARGDVIYDKGEISDGWRYLEISYYQYMERWGSTDLFIPDIPGDFGKGFDNSKKIIQYSGESYSAAKLCSILTMNGFSDWFLPTTEELLVILKSYKSQGITIHGRFWTSTQKDKSNAYSIMFNEVSNEFDLLVDPKDQQNRILPIRRY
ncbi:hypothetical protein [Elizabethkingia anophelis]|uniref:hypothetical protein n=1 Tax=Elizabethkingia anophelis TaxID=1117645 RepID=UPI0024696445|nr:hypothetical protein [Elizabethkingia anophelis]WGL68035.1 hypothetical protein QFB79_09015 [Elizabethkingia anophelis]